MKTNNKITQEIIEKVNCPFQVFSEDCTIEDVNHAYEEALERGKQKGFVPILVVSDETLAEWLGILEDDSYSKEAVLGQNLDGKEILKKCYLEYTEDYMDESEEDGENDMKLSELMGEKAGGEELVCLASFMKYNGDGIEETILFEIPVKNPWEVIAWLPVGGWNECPEASEMMAVCRSWYERYGAVPAVVSHDTLEFAVKEPVKEEQAAWELAKEHYAFSPDRVAQCTASYTIGELADCISKSTVWYFWWD